MFSVAKEFSQNKILLAFACLTFRCADLTEVRRTVRTMAMADTDDLPIEDDEHDGDHTATHPLDHQMDILPSSFLLLGNAGIFPKHEMGTENRLTSR